MSWSNEASVRVPGGRIAYSDVGEGRAVLLLHGFPMSSLLWRRDVPLLASRMRVIVADLLGFGASDAKGSADLSASAQAKCLGALLAVLGIDEVAVVGHGAGGAVALRMALDEEGPRVGCLVMMDAPAFEDRPLGGVGMAPELLGGTPGPGDVAAAMGGIIDRGVSRAGRVDEETR
ncbi:MAG: alpha/beta fold hydrolase, partial [Deltaproteobacteria bacterium]